MVDIEKNAYVHLELRDGKLIASTGVGGDDEEFERAVAPHNDGEWVNIWLAFPVSEILEGTIESFVHGNRQGNELDEEAKPRIDALRAELAAMIEKIDAITYA